MFTAADCSVAPSATGTVGDVPLAEVIVEDEELSVRLACPVEVVDVVVNGFKVVDSFGIEANVASLE